MTPEGEGQKSVVVPDNAMVCGLVTALSVIVNVAVFGPTVDPQGADADTASGVNVTVSVQDPAAGTPAVQLLVAVKLPAGVTLGTPTFKIAGAVPLLAIVTVTGVEAVPANALPKLMAGDGVIVAVACTAWPLSAIVCALAVALSEICNTAARLPIWTGSKVTLITQVLPAPTDPPKQLSDS